MPWYLCVGILLSREPHFFFQDGISDVLKEIHDYRM